jgi:predicted PurR-regulated permease PerM
MIDIKLIQFLNDIKLKINDIENRLYFEDNIRTNTIDSIDSIIINDNKEKEKSLTNIFNNYINYLEKVKKKKNSLFNLHINKIVFSISFIIHILLYYLHSLDSNEIDNNKACIQELKNFLNKTYNSLIIL